MVAFALPDVARKPLPVSNAKAAAPATNHPAPALGNPVAAPVRPGEAKALMEKTCGTTCHSVDVVTSQRMTENEWNATVQTMVARGAKASDAQVKILVEYLAKTFGPKAN